MRRIVFFALSLMLCLMLLTVGVFAETEEVTGKEVTLYEQDAPTVLAAGEALPTPVAVQGKLFVGWLGEKTEALEAALLPAGAVPPADGHDSYRALFVGMTVREGTTLRLTEDSEGLRFLTDIVAADLALLRDCAEVGFGTIIAPRDYVRNSGNILTPEALAAAGYTKYLDIPTPGAYEQTEEFFTIAGSIANIRPENRNLRFYAAGYLSIAYADGTTARVYASHQTKGTIRLYDHVKTAFGDLTAEQDETHQHATDHGYSPYTESERDFMKEVIDSVISLEYVLENPSKPSSSKLIANIKPDIDAYQAPFDATYDEDNGKFTLTVREGEAYRFDVDFAVLILDGSEVPAKFVATIEEGGKRMVVKFSSYTPNI